MNKDLIQQASKALAIKDVYLHTCNVDIAEGFDCKHTKYPELGVHVRQNVVSWVEGVGVSSDGEESTYLRFEFLGAFRLVPPDSDSDSVEDDSSDTNVLVEVTATFLAEYLKKDDIKDKAIEEFATFNVAHNVWPYWREFAQSLTERMRLPRLVLPLYSLPQDTFAKNAQHDSANQD